MIELSPEDAEQLIEEISQVVLKYVGVNVDVAPTEMLVSEGLAEKLGLLTEEEEEAMFRGVIPEGWEHGVYRAIRSKSTGDRVFLDVNGKERRWIPDLETLTRLGIKLEDVADISEEEMARYKEGYGLLSVKLWNE